MTVLNIPWVRWFNSFGFITILVFSFVVLTTLVFPASEGKGNISRVHTLVQADGGLSPGRFKTITVLRQGESSGKVYTVRGP
jgi:hypothetical protein